VRLSLQPFMSGIAEMTDLLLKFNASKEVLPEDGQNIVYLRESGSFGYSGVQIAEAVVRWLVSDANGTFWEYSDSPLGEVLHVYVGDKDAHSQNVWWIDEKEYWQQFDVADAELGQLK